MDDALFKQLLQATPSAPTPPGSDAGQPAPPLGETAAGAPEAVGAIQPPMSPEMADFQASLPADLTAPRRDALGKPSDFLDAALAGAGQAALETKDFVVGEPTEKSEARQSFEAGAKAARDAGGANPVIEGITQFAVGMLGAGKLLAASRMVPAVGGALSTVEATRRGAYAVQSARAASVGAVAFDPHQERLSNLLEQVPVVGGPIFGWLAADPADAAWEGRAKAALESIGLDAVLGLTFLAGAKLLKAVRGGGSPEAVEVATRELEAAQAAESARASEPAPLGAATAREAAEATPPAATPEGAPAATGEAPMARSAAGEVEGVANGAVLHGPAAAPRAESPQPRVTPVAPVTIEEAEMIVAGIRADLDAIDDAGSLPGAVDAGHVFGRGANIPWNKLNLPGEVDDFVARVADAIETQLNRAKGGDILSDARVNRQLNGIASYFNMDPGTIVGRIQQSGAAASRMVADMEAAYLIANRMLTEAFNSASRISLGDFMGMPSREAAMAEFQRQVTLAGSMLASGQSMRAAMGRGLRRLRPEFAVDPELAERVNAMDGEKLLHLFNATAGDPRKLKVATGKTFLRKAADEAGFLIQNNLLWGLGTHIVNFASNAAMLYARPGGRAIGALATGNTRLAREQLEQVIYYPTAFVDGFSSVVQALKLSESVIDPRHTAFVLEARTVAIRDGAFRSWGSVAGTLHNAYLILALPTRALTASDEMMKQTIYRSKVASMAWSEGVDAGLAGKDLRHFIKERMDGAFDAAGRATNMAAVQEARIATFSQDLLPTGWGDIETMGKTIRGAVANQPILRPILPFTQTPTNLFRYTMKLSPGFNLMQQEYNHMLRGKMGAEAQADAIGQMALGTLAMGAIAVGALNMTGAGPADPKVRAEKMATGWRPYAIPAENDDGTVTYWPAGRLDPVALPFGMVSDIMDYMHATGDTSSSTLQGAISTLAYSLIKQTTNKTYMTGLSRALDAFTDPKQHLSRFAGATALEFLPFSSLMRTQNPDPYLREARSVVDHLMAGIPGLSEELNPRRDWGGDPIRDRTDFLSVSPRDSLTAEMNRMQSLGYSIVPPVPTVHHADLRDVTLEDGRNAWDVYQQLAAQPDPGAPRIKEVVAKAIETEAYKTAEDGPIDVIGTKLWLLHGPIIMYRKLAQEVLMQDANYRTAVNTAQQKVVDAYKANEQGGPKTPPPGGVDALRAIGRAFGLTP